MSQTTRQRERRHSGAQEIVTPGFDLDYGPVLRSRISGRSANGHPALVYDLMTRKGFPYYVCSQASSITLLSVAQYALYINLQAASQFLHPPLKHLSFLALSYKKIHYQTNILVSICLQDSSRLKHPKPYLTATGSFIMAPGALLVAGNHLRSPKKGNSPLTRSPMSFLQDHRTTRPGYLHAVDCDGKWVHLSDGRKILDGSGGAGVACIGAKDKRVLEAYEKQFWTGPLYAPSLDFTTSPYEALEEYLCYSTHRDFNYMIAYGSGSESVEAALKLVLQYQALMKGPSDPKCNVFIARHQSYHGATFGALDVSGHAARRSPYLDVLPRNTKFISPYYPFRDAKGKTATEYVEHLKKEFIDKIEEIGPKTVAGFIMEPVVGAALGCVAATEGYMKAMQDVCKKYGILFIADEIMCGLGRTGSYHAYQQHEGVVPDILLLGKGLAGGYAPISALLVSEEITEAMQLKSRPSRFNHGHTFQNHAGACVQALAVQSIIIDDGLVENVEIQGARLEKMLRTRLGKHKHIGEIRGVGLFWALEFVKDRNTNEPFDANRKISWRLHELGLQPQHEIYTYPGTGSVGGTAGDHMILAPAYNVTTEELELIVDRVVKLVTDFFENEDNSRIPSTL